MQLGIRDKLALLSLLISLVGLFVVGVVLQRATAAELRAGIEQNLLSYGELQHQRVQAFIRQHNERFALMTAHPRLHLALHSYLQGAPQYRDQLAALLDDARQVSLQFQELALFSPDGELLAVTGDGWLPDREQVVSSYADNTEPVLQWCTLNRNQLDLCLGGAVTIAGERVGVLLALVQLNTLQELTAIHVNIGMNVETLLSRRLPDDLVQTILPPVFHAPHELGQAVEPNPFLLMRTAGENRVLTIDDPDGSSFLAVVRSFDKVDWALMVKVDRSDALVALDRQRETLIKLLLSLLIVAIVLSLWFASSLTRPISDLTSMAMKIAAGDLKHRIRVNRDDEIGMLGLAFNQMADRLVATHENLEEKVRVKSAELLLLNRRLTEANENLEQQVLRDRLTGIGNRRGFDRAIHEEWRRCRRDGTPLTLLFMDVDYFKGFNDALGHTAGDKALRSIAQVLSGHARRPGDLVARYGGDEFVLLLPNLTSEQAKLVATGIQEALREQNISHPCSQASKRVTLSIGIATMKPSETSMPAELVRAADEALYYAKAQGRNCWFVASIN